MEAKKANRDIHKEASRLLSREEQQYKGTDGGLRTDFQYMKNKK